MTHSLPDWPRVDHPFAAMSVVVVVVVVVVPIAYAPARCALHLCMPRTLGSVWRSQDSMCKLRGLASWALPLERAFAHVCQEVGALVARNLRLADMNIEVPVSDDCRALVPFR